MRFNINDPVEKRECPPSIAALLTVAGGLNRFGEPLFRVVWGYNRIVPFHGEWQEWEQQVATLTDKLTGHTESRQFIRLKESKIETRELPKYLPANCWHLEKWCPPEDYGSPEIWRTAGQEVVAGMTIDTSGEFPHRGEYELVFPLTTDFTCDGKPLPLEGAFVEQLVHLVRVGKERFSMVQRKAAIEQRLIREEDGFSRRAVDIMKDGMRPFCSETFVTVPKDVK